VNAKRMSVTDHVCQHGNTPLIDAVSKGQADVVLLLIDHGADLNLANDVSGTTVPN
jgi:ankyrin repeat protein